jgi:hypothetical protein
MKVLRARKAIALTRGEDLRGDAFALLGYCFLFGMIIAAVLAMHGLPAP